MTTKRTRTTRPLRSSPITGPSPLLRGGPSPCRASVLSPSQFQLLGVLPSAAGVNTPAGAITARGSHVSCQRPDRARATSVPGNRQGSKQVSPWLFPGQQLDPGYDCRRYAYDTSAVVHSRSPSRSPPDASRAPFPWCSSPRLIHRSNPRWFTASPCRAAVEGLPPSPAQHRNHQRDLLHRNLQSRSWRTVVGVPAVAEPPVARIPGIHAGQAALLLAHLACCGEVAAFAGAHGSHSRPGVCRIGSPAHAPGVLRYENCLDERVQPVQVNIGEDW